MPDYIHIESPYRGVNGIESRKNRAYIKQAIYDCIDRKEVPYAAHLFYTQVYDDYVKEEREKGMKLGFWMMLKMDIVAFYLDRGFSQGMKLGLDFAIKNGKVIEYRFIQGNRKVLPEFLEFKEKLDKAKRTELKLDDLKLRKGIR